MDNVNVGPSWSLPPDYNAKIDATEDQALQDFVGELARLQLGPEASEADVKALAGELSKTTLPQLRQQYYQIHEQAVNKAGPEATPADVQEIETKLFSELKADCREAVTKTGVADIKGAVQTFATEHLTSAGGTGKKEAVDTDSGVPKLETPAQGYEGIQAETVATQWFTNIISNEHTQGVLQGLMHHIPTDWQNDIAAIVAGDLTCLEGLDPKTADNLMVIGGYVKLMAQVMSFAKTLLANIAGTAGEGSLADKIHERMARKMNMEDFYKRVGDNLKKAEDAEVGGGLFGGIFGDMSVGIADGLQKAMMGLGITGLVGGALGGILGVGAGAFFLGLGQALGFAGLGVMMVMLVVFNILTLGAGVILIAVLAPVMAALLVGVAAAGTIIAGAAPFAALALSIMMIVDGAGHGPFTPTQDDIDAAKDEITRATQAIINQRTEDLDEERDEKVAEQIAIILMIVTSLIAMLTAAVESAGASLPSAGGAEGPAKPQGEFDANKFVNDANTMMAAGLSSSAIRELAEQMGMKPLDARALEKDISANILAFSHPEISSGGRRGRRTQESAISYDHYNQAANVQEARNLVLNNLGLTKEFKDDPETTNVNEATVILDYLTGTVGPQMTEFLQKIMMGINQRVEDNKPDKKNIDYMPPISGA